MRVRSWSGGAPALPELVSASKLLQGFLYIYKMIVEDLLGDVQELKHSRVDAGVVDVIALFAGGDEILALQHGELLGDVRHLDF